MVVLREGMCPGLEENIVRDLRAANITTGVCMCVWTGMGMSLLKWLNR